MKVGKQVRNGEWGYRAHVGKVGEMLGVINFHHVQYFPVLRTVYLWYPLPSNGMVKKKHPWLWRDYGSGF